jgi:hypothetical protein
VKGPVGSALARMNMPDDYSEEVGWIDPLYAAYRPAIPLADSVMALWSDRPGNAMRVASRMGRRERMAMPSSTRPSPSLGMKSAFHWEA